MSLEMFLSKNLRYISINSIIAEINQVINFYKFHISEVGYYLDTINQIIKEIDIFYNNIYHLCLQKMNGFSILSNVGSIFLYTFRYLEIIRSKWSNYLLVLKTFYYTLYKLLSQYISVVNSNLKNTYWKNISDQTGLDWSFTTNLGSN